MLSKEVTLILGDCYAMVNLKNDDDTVSLELVELEIDQENSTKEYTNHKTLSATTLYLGPEDVQALIDSLQLIAPKEDI